jgi:dipeptidyl-peptidase-4
VRYPAVDAANADVSLWLIGLDGDRVEARWDRDAYEYLVSAGWDDHGPYAVVQSRDQCTVRFLAIDPATGATSVVAEQRDECWVQLIRGAPTRTASGALVSHVDRHGTRHLTVDGVAVTSAGTQLREVLGVDGEDVLFTASDDPTETHVWSYGPVTGLRRWSDEPGVHTAVRQGDTTVVLTQRAADHRVCVLREGKPAVPVTSHRETPVLDVRATSLVLGPRQLRGRLHLPTWHTGGRLPVLVDPYGGAGAQRVTAEHDAKVLVSQWFAEQGFAVLVVDGSGTPGRGPAWEREVHADLFTPVLDDQVAALHEAASLHPELDLARVGIRGWSFSGSLAAFAVLSRPDVFHVAVAGAGVTDQYLYNAHWRERFLGHPADHPDRYEATSLIRLAPALMRPLLLIHGLADTNVFPANTFRLSSALQAAGKAHEVLLLPGVGHQAIGEPGTEHLLEHQARFLRRYLVDACP